jgi:hypothetical protein
MQVQQKQKKPHAGLAEEVGATFRGIRSIQKEK